MFWYLTRSKEYTRGQDDAYEVGQEEVPSTYKDFLHLALIKLIHRVQPPITCSKRNPPTLSDCPFSVLHRATQSYSPMANLQPHYTMSPREQQPPLPHDNVYASYQLGMENLNLYYPASYSEYSPNVLHHMGG